MLTNASKALHPHLNGYCYKKTKIENGAVWSSQLWDQQQSQRAWMWADESGLQECSLPPWLRGSRSKTTQDDLAALLEECGCLSNAFK